MLVDEDGAMYGTGEDQTDTLKHCRESWYR
jgi:hypothetical protein